MPVPQDQRSRSPKIASTVHGYAQSGDLVGLQKLLHDDPSLLNKRNDILAQTPVHIGAGYNNVEIVKYLLKFHGQEKVEIEAKNMYGETPLHMATKHGCSGAARVLLDHGASVEAKANNGMTPLHLAVWHSRGREDCSTVKMLLEYNSDCSVKDDDDMTPIDYVSEGPNCEKLRELLHSHLEKQRMHKAGEVCCEAKAKMDEFEDAISSIIGLNDLKVQLRKFAKGMLLDEKRRALGLKVSARKLPHMAFLGNPGTGKTMVARVLGRLLHMIGILPTDRVTEVQRTDLVGEFVGHTGPKTRRKIKEAEGGILFVDEAYRLIPMQKADDKDYGLEALEEIMSFMDSGKVVVIFAGYSEPMKRVISSNEGFCRRVTKFFVFGDFNTQELAQIVHLRMNNQAVDSSLYGFKLHPSCTLDAIAKLIEKETTEKQRKEMNGGLVDPMLVNAREILDLRLDFDTATVNDLLTITLEDLEGGLRSLTQ